MCAVDGEAVDREPHTIKHCRIPELIITKMRVRGRSRVDRSQVLAVF